MNATVENCVSASRDRHRFKEDGFQIIHEALSHAECAALAEELTALFQQQQDGSRRMIGGVRNVLRLSPIVADIATSSKLVFLASDLVERRVFPVTAIFFDKTSAANWNVPWHQDLVIPVTERIETPGFGPWSVKDGVVHVQPSLHILDEMVAVRLHLDDCFADNGALRLISGSHLHGELDSDQITQWTTTQIPVVCEIPKGGALLMRPLLLHASSAAKHPSHRRVLHIEYAAGELPNGLRWFEWE